MCMLGLENAFQSLCNLSRRPFLFSCHPFWCLQPLKLQVEVLSKVLPSGHDDRVWNCCAVWPDILGQIVGVDRRVVLWCLLCVVVDVGSQAHNTVDRLPSKNCCWDIPGMLIESWYGPRHMSTYMPCKASAKLGPHFNFSLFPLSWIWLVFNISGDDLGHVGTSWYCCHGSFSVLYSPCNSVPSFITEQFIVCCGFIKSILLVYSQLVHTIKSFSLKVFLWQIQQYKSI